MAKNKVQEGDVIELVTLFGNVTAGMCITNDRLIGVALHDQPTNGQPVQAATTGVWDLLKSAPSDVYTRGQLVYVTASATASVTPNSGAHKLIGVATEPSANGATTVRVRLNGIAAPL